jgi:hypothetical protein
VYLGEAGEAFSPPIRAYAASSSEDDRHKFEWEIQGRRAVYTRLAAPFSRWHERPRFFVIFSGSRFKVLF